MRRLPVEVKVRECMKRHPEKVKFWQIADYSGMSVGQVRLVLEGMKKGKGCMSTEENQVKRGKSMEQFRQQFDVKLRIRQGIKKHLAGCYMTDQEFRDACGVSSAEWRKHAYEMEFDQNRAKIRGQTFWAQAKMLNEMKNIAGVVN